MDLSDAVKTLGYLFLATGALPCLDAADTNDDGKIDISDPISTLEFLFLGRAGLAPHEIPGADPTPDSLGSRYGV